MTNTPLNINHNEFNHSLKLKTTKAATTTSNKIWDKENKERCSFANSRVPRPRELANEQ